MKCQYCGYIFTKHETLQGDKNHRDGDISFCINCGEVSQFKGNKISKINELDLDEKTRKEVFRIQHAWLRSVARYMQK